MKNWIFIIWCVLALVSFGCAFFTAPLFAKIVGLVFGAENLMIIGGWLYGNIMEKKALKKSKEE